MNDVADILTDAADYCAKLAAVEHAHILDDQDELDHLLSSVDPIDVRQTANLLYALAKIRGATDNADPGGSGGGSVSPLPSRVTSDTAPTAGESQASAPDVPQVRHIGDSWSRKVRCS